MSYLGSSQDVTAPQKTGWDRIHHVGSIDRLKLLLLVTTNTYIFETQSSGVHN